MIYINRACKPKVFNRITVLRYLVDIACHPVNTPEHKCDQQGKVKCTDRCIVVVNGQTVILAEVSSRLHSLRW